MPGEQAASQLVAEQTLQAVVQLMARGDHAGEGATEQEPKETFSAYYVDSPSDDEVGAAAEALVDNVLEDLELLFQEQLTALAEDATE